VPIAVGTDTGGSIREPASFCNVVGVKPTYGRVSRYGIIAFASSLDQAGPLTADVRDSADTLEAIAGYDPMDSTSVDVPVPHYADMLRSDLRGVRIGIVDEFEASIKGDAKLAGLYAAAYKKLEELGAQLVRAGGYDLLSELQESPQTDFVRLEFRDLRPDVHVEAQQPDVLHFQGTLGDNQRLVEWNSKLHSLDAGARVRMRSVHHDFRIHSERHRRLHLHFTGNRIQELELIGRLHVDQQNSERQSLLELASRLAYSAENDVGAAIAGRFCAVELAAGNNVEASSKLSQDLKNSQAGIGLDAVVKAMGKALERR